MNSFQWSVFAPVLVQLAYAALAVLLALIAWKLRAIASNKALSTQQQAWATTALRLVTAAEQDFAAATGKTGTTKFGQVDAGLAAILPKTVTAAQRKTMIQAAVYALHAGVVAVAPGAAAILPPLQGAGVGAAPFDTEAFKADVSALATTVAQGAVQSGLRDTLTTVLGIAPPQTVPAQAPVTVNVLPAGTVATMPIGDDGSPAPINVAPAQG